MIVENIEHITLSSSNSLLSLERSLQDNRKPYIKVETTWLQWDKKYYDNGDRDFVNTDNVSCNVYDYSSNPNKITSINADDINTDAVANSKRDSFSVEDVTSPKYDNFTLIYVHNGTAIANGAPGHFTPGPVSDPIMYSGLISDIKLMSRKNEEGRLLLDGGLWRFFNALDDEYPFRPDYINFDECELHLL